MRGPSIPFLGVLPSFYWRSWPNDHQHRLLHFDSRRMLIGFVMTR